MITGILVIAAFAIAVVIGIIYLIFSLMVFPSQEETADKGYQGETENFISRKTVLYVSVNGIWKESRFLRFDIKNGKKVVYVNCGGTESFYAYPSKYVKTKYEDVKKANAEKKIKESKYIPENLEAIAIANAYKKYPASHRPSEIAENEKEHELEYHSRVDKKLDELDDAAHAQLSEAYDLESKSRDTLRQAYIDERESDTFKCVIIVSGGQPCRRRTTKKSSS